MNKLWIARDKNGSLWIHGAKPWKWSEQEWISNSAEQIKLPKSWFKEVTFKNSPRQVEIKLLEP